MTTPAEFTSLNNDVFLQLQSVLIQQIEDELSDMAAIDITRMLATKLSFIQRKIAEALS